MKHTNIIKLCWYAGLLLTTHLGGMTTTTALVCQEKQNSAKQNSVNSQTGSIVVHNNTAFFTIPSTAIPHSAMLSAMVSSHFAEHTTWANNNDITVDLTEQQYSNKSLLLFSNLMNDLAIGSLERNLLNYPTSLLLELYELSHYFLVDFRPLLLKACTPFELMLFGSKDFLVSKKVSRWDFITHNASKCILLSYARSRSTLSLWDIKKNNCLRTFNNKHTISSYFVNQEETVIAAAGLYEHMITIWNIEKGSILASRNDLEYPEILGYVDKTSVLIKHDSKHLTVWDYTENKDRCSITAPSHIASVETFNNEQSVAVSTNTDYAYRWDIKTGTLLSKLNTNALILTMSLNPQKTHAALALGNKTVIIWDLASDKIAKTLHCDILSSTLVWNPQGTKIALLFNTYGNKERKCAQLWDIAQESVIGSIEHEQPIDVVSWDPSGTLFATGARDGLVKVFNCLTQQYSHAFSHSYWISNISWSDDSNYLISTDSGHHVKMWYLPKQRCIDVITYEVEPDRIEWDGTHQALIGQFLGEEFEVKYVDLDAIDNESLWTMLLLKRAFIEGKKIKTYPESWIATTYFTFPPEIKYAHSHLEIDYKIPSIGFYDYSITCSALVQNGRCAHEVV